MRGSDQLPRPRHVKLIGQYMKKLLTLAFLIITIFAGCSGADDPDEYWVRYIKYDPGLIMLIVFDDGDAVLYRDNDPSIRFELTDKEFRSLSDLTTPEKLDLYEQDDQNLIESRRDEAQITIVSDTGAVGIEVSEANSSSDTQKFIQWTTDIITRAHQL